MRMQTQAIFYMFCVNIAILIVLNLNVPGVEYAQNLGASAISMVQISNAFNVTALTEKWNANWFSAVFDFLVSGITFLIAVIPFALFGFAAVLMWFGPLLIQDTAGLTAYNMLIGFLGVMFGILIFFWIVEVVTGRQLYD
jgi:hypothetical protein